MRATNQPFPRNGFLPLWKEDNMADLVQVAHGEVSGDYSDSVLVWQRFLEYINRIPRLTVIGSLKHDFPGGGFSGVILLGESHAAIHTWPEHNKAWVELAVCGDPSA